MKLSKILLISGIAAALSFTSCVKDAEYTPGEAAQGTQLMGATFETNNNVTVELDPSDATNYTMMVSRADSTQAVAVPVKVLTNTGSIFTVPATVEFKAGEKVAPLTVKYDKAEVGTKYSLEVALDDAYVNPYTATTKKTFHYSFTRVKWNNLGTTYLIDDAWYGDKFEVELFQRDDAPESFRFQSPYTDDYTGGGATYDAWWNFNIKNGYISWTVFCPNTFNADYGAEIKYYFPSYLSSSLAANDEESYVEYNEDGTPWYITFNPYLYMDGVGGYGCYPLFMSFPGQPLPVIEDYDCWWLEEE